MNKQQVVWLIVRLIGVYFVYSAIATAFSLPGAVSTLYSLSPSRPAAVKPEIENARSTPAPFPAYPRAESDTPATKLTDPTAEAAKSQAFKALLKIILLTAIYGGVGIYLIRWGRFLFNLLNNETSTKLYEDDPAVTTLKL